MADPTVTPPKPPSTIVIEELVGNPPQKVTLAGDDMPEGRRHEIAAFESGGKTDVAKDGIYNPGSKRVVLQVMARKYHPMVLKGSFRDVFYAVGHARNQRDALESIAERANPVSVTWGDQIRQGLLWETKFGEESENDITYELTFFVAKSPAKKDRPTTLPLGTQGASDRVAQLQAQVDQLRAQLDNVALNPSVQTTLGDAWDAAQTGLSNALLAGSIIDVTTQKTAQALVTASRRVVTTAQSAATQVRALQSLYASLTTADLNPSDAAAQFMASVTLSRVTLDSHVQFLQILDGLRSLSQEALLKVRSATRVYRVQTGDTLDSIALAQLGSKARAMDLGIPSSALVPGALIRIPEGA